MIKNAFLAAVFLALFSAGSSHAQTASLTIEDCYRLARENYPLIKKQDIISKSSRYSVENASKLYLPQLNISGQATYQSTTFSFPDALQNIPGISLPAISKDQYKLQAEITQNIYDGGNSRNQKAAVRADEAVQQQSLEVNLYAVNERVNQVYFAILLMNEQLKQNGIRIADLQSAADKTEAALQNGTAFRSNLDELKAEITNAEMTSIEFRSNKAAYYQMLSVLIGKAIDSTTELITPIPKTEQFNINRPELKLYELQKAAYNVEEKKLHANYTPSVNAFFQGAYGRPTLNIIDNKFGPWYITGIRLNWSLGSLYSLKNNQRIIQLNRQKIEADRETFLYNTRFDLYQESGEVKKYRELIEQDKKAIALRESVKKASQAQLDNGVITVHDYISQANAENLARQVLILHNIQLLQAQYQLNHISGN